MAFYSFHVLEVLELQFLNWDPISFIVESGECLGLTGRSGSGKTLLLRAIADLDVNTGEVSLDGKDRDELSGSDWRSRVGMLAAESRWWHECVGPHFVSASDAQGLLEDLGFSGHEVMDWEVSRLSSGEKQRLALARLLSRSPNALLLDEPTANLDPESVERVEEVINSYRTKRKVPVIWVAHDESQLDRIAATLFCMKNKKLEEVE